MKQYDIHQQAAIEAAGGHYLVLAPPGCGKTDILAARIAHAHSRGVEMGQMLCLTFTNRAARGMRARVEEMVGEGAADVFVGNVHRFCSKYIFGEKVVAENASIHDEDETADILDSCSPGAYTTRSGEVNRGAVQYVGRLATYITQSRLGQPEEVKPADPEYPGLYAEAEACEFCPESVDDRSLAHALRYLDYKREHSLLDFDDLLVLAYEHLRGHEHCTYPWIQVDEVQDLNPLQLAIVDELTAPGATVMYLGDEQQAIFSFMGAKLSLLSLLKERCRGHILTLGHNYRAPRYLLEVCNAYATRQLGVDPELLPQPVRDDPREPLDLILTGARTGTDENARIMGMVRHYLSLDDDGRLAILVTKNHQADDISHTLTRAGIPHFKISGQDMFKRGAYKTLTSLYCVLSNDHNMVAWSRLLQGTGAYRHLSAARTAMRELREAGMTPSDLLEEQSAMERFRRCWLGECVVFDTETTGLDTAADEIVQIAACRVCEGRKVEGSEFSVILETSRPIPAEVGGAPNPVLELYAASPHTPRAEGLQAFLDYIGDLPLVGHNVTYDYLMLQQACARDLGEHIVCRVHDTLHLAKCAEPGLRRYDLASLVETLGLEGRNTHLAHEDVEATVSLGHWCARRAGELAPAQRQWRRSVAGRQLAAKMQVLEPLLADVRSVLHLPVAVTRRDIASELGYMHGRMVEMGLIKPLGEKFDTFLRYVQSEWTDPTGASTLHDQIRAHIYDMTGTLNEGDLVNSADTVQDRVFVMTVYKGKGLEFDNVVVLNASDGNYPFWGVRKAMREAYSEAARRRAEAALREEARKFYVAISRARRRLCVSYSGRCTPFMECIADFFE